MYEVRILEAATSELDGLDRAIVRRVVERIRWLAAKLNNLRPEALGANLAGFYKHRVGD